VDLISERAGVHINEEGCPELTTPAGTADFSIARTAQGTLGT